MARQALVIGGPVLGYVIGSLVKDSPWFFVALLVVSIGVALGSLWLDRRLKDQT